MAFLNMVISIGGVITNFVYNGLSTLAVAAYTAASKLESFVIQPFLSLGSATAVFAAQNYGAGKYKRIRKGVNSALVMSLIWIAIATCLVFAVGRPALKLVVSTEGVTTAEYNTIMSDGFFYIIANTLLTVLLAPLVIYKNALQALSRATLPLVSGFTEIIGRAGTAILLSPIFGFAGVCFANPAAWLMGLIPIAIDYFLFMRKLKKIEG
jgi:Na+-driven multidrug efflux pump